MSNTNIKIKQLYLKAPFGIVVVDTDKIDGANAETTDGSYMRQAIDFSFDYRLEDKRGVWNRVKGLFNGKKLHYKPDNLTLRFIGSVELRTGEIFATGTATSAGGYPYEVLGYDLMSVISHANSNLRERGMVLDVSPIPHQLGHQFKISDGKQHANKSKASNNKGPETRKGRVSSARSKSRRSVRGKGR